MSPECAAPLTCHALDVATVTFLVILPCFVTSSLGRDARSSNVGRAALERGCVIAGSDDGCDEHSRWCSHCARQRQEEHKSAAQLLQNQLRAGEATAQGHQAREPYD